MRCFDLLNFGEEDAVVLACSVESLNRRATHNHIDQQLTVSKGNIVCATHRISRNSACKMGVPRLDSGKVGALANEWPRIFFLCHRPTITKSASLQESLQIIRGLTFRQADRLSWNLDALTPYSTFHRNLWVPYNSAQICTNSHSSRKFLKRLVSEL